MNFFDDIKIGNSFNSLDGLYSDHDSQYIYSVVRKLKPTRIIDFGPREGKTTSTIIQALIKNGIEVKYHIFEKDEQYYNSIKKYCENTCPEFIKYQIGQNIIDYDLSEIDNVDLLFIDANHDYILARWYIENLFPLLSEGSVIHIHDIPYNRFGNGWEDIKMSNKVSHPDLIDLDTIKRLYPTIFDMYSDGNNEVTRYEADEIYDFHMRNPHLDWHSTYVTPESTVFPDCSMYFHIDKSLLK